MEVNDSVYGVEEIEEDVLIDLINSKAIQRLKGISQFGMPDEYYHLKGFSRYEHSVGVMILLRRLGADLKEQIAGLLHDVSHTAFSHVIDWAIGDPTKEDYQDNTLLDVIKKSRIPGILERHGFDFDLLTDMENYTLLERPAPFLCADRVDYFLRELRGIETGEKFNMILRSLINYDGKIVFNSKEAAEMFANGYAGRQRVHWAGREAKVRYFILGNILRRAIQNNFISLDDMKKTDNEVIDMISGCDDNEIVEGLRLLREGFVLKELKSENAVGLQKKFRYVDPEVLLDDGLVRLSEISENYRISLVKQKENSEKIDFVEIFPK